MNKSAVACLALAAASSQAASFTGNDYLELRRRDSLAAMEYIAGMIDGSYSTEMAARFAAKEAGEPVSIGVTRASLCLPADATNGQVTDLVTQYIESHPATRHLPTGALAWVSLHEIWPCKAPR